jgi:putative phage-type endonuclease
MRTQALDRAHWLAVRKRGIGSSDAAAAVGLNPYKSQLELWMEKTGRDAGLPKIDPEDDTTPAYWGSLLEHIVAAQYTRRTGRRVRRINAVLQHPSKPWMLANIDREVVGAADVQILECKTAGINGARLWRDGVPEYVQLQVMHQLAVTGKQAADVAVLIGGQELQVHRIERDEKLITQLVELERRFWLMVEEERPPMTDGSESARQALLALYPHDRGEVLDFTGDLAMSALFSDLLAVRQLLRSQSELEAQIKQAIQQRMGSASQAVFETGAVSWKRTQDTQVLDTERLMRDEPELTRCFMTTRPGSRRFTVHEDNG